SCPELRALHESISENRRPGCQGAGPLRGSRAAPAMETQGGSGGGTGSPECSAATARGHAGRGEDPAEGWPAPLVAGIGGAPHPLSGKRVGSVGERNPRVHGIQCGHEGEVRSPAIGGWCGSCAGDDASGGNARVGRGRFPADRGAGRGCPVQPRQREDEGASGYLGRTCPSAKGSVHVCAECRGVQQHDEAALRSAGGSRQGQKGRSRRLYEEAVDLAERHDPGQKTLESGIRSLDVKTATLPSTVQNPPSAMPPPRSIFTPMRFVKMHGTGNDYVYVDAFRETVE